MCEAIAFRSTKLNKVVAADKLRDALQKDKIKAGPDVQNALEEFATGKAKIAKLQEKIDKLQAQQQAEASKYVVPALSKLEEALERAQYKTIETSNAYIALVECGANTPVAYKAILERLKKDLPKKYAAMIDAIVESYKELAHKVDIDLMIVPKTTAEKVLEATKVEDLYARVKSWINSFSALSRRKSFELNQSILEARELINQIRKECGARGN